MLKIAGIVTLVLCCIGIFLDWFIGPAALVFAPMELNEEEQKAMKKGCVIYNIALLGLIVLSFILNYLAYN